MRLRDLDVGAIAGIGNHQILVVAYLLPKGAVIVVRASTVAMTLVNDLRVLAAFTVFRSEIEAKRAIAGQAKVKR